ncbi:MAG: PQQ-binding-like beta-propeller repeat protein [Candidatus Poseidoniaceae archaeon]
MRVATLFLVLVLFLPLAQATTESSWTHEFEDGYITTKPLIVDDSVYVRTSGFWTGDARPVVVAFDVQSGDEHWRYTSQTSIQHDMSPLLHAEQGSGDCGSWQNLLIVGWADGKITAHSTEDGTVVWENQTEIDLIGITGSMLIEDDQVIVPTRSGLSSFCLANGEEILSVDVGFIGWRNGVTAVEEGFVFGDESGNLHTVFHNGSVSSIHLGDGKIRHAPLDTRHGLFVHLQTDEGSTMFLNGSVLASVGQSPAIPLMHEHRIYAATSDEWISILCDEDTCSIEATEPFHSNGELALRIVGTEVEIWAHSNTVSGGWGVFNQTAFVRMENTSFNTYGTAAPGFGPGVIAFGNDAGMLKVTSESLEASNEEETPADILGGIHYVAIVLLFLVTCWSLAHRDLNQLTKVGSAFLLLIAIAVVPELSLKLAEQTSTNSEAEWDPSWPDEWLGTQVIVFEIDGEEHAIGGLERQQTVYDLTMIACDELGIETEIEQQYLGAYLVSFNGSVGDGWEFTLDGSRSQVGMTESQLNDASIVEWRPA